MGSCGSTPEPAQPLRADLELVSGPQTAIQCLGQMQRLNWTPGYTIKNTGGLRRGCSERSEPEKKIT